MSSPDSSKVCSQTTIEVIPFQILSAAPVDGTQREGDLAKMANLTKIISSPDPNETLRFTDSGQLRLSFADTSDV